MGEVSGCGGMTRRPELVTRASPGEPGCEVPLCREDSTRPDEVRRLDGNRSGSADDIGCAGGKAEAEARYEKEDDERPHDPSMLNPRAPVLKSPGAWQELELISE